MQKIEEIAVLILAAGASTRLGKPKQLIKVDGLTLLQKTILSALRAGLGKIIVVLGANAESIAASIVQMPVCIEYNQNWSEGMSTSLKLGVETIESDFPNVNAILVLLSDQPFVSKDLLTELLKANMHSSKKIIASKYGTTIGVPAIFPKRFFSELKNISGDKGARKLIIENRNFVKTVSFEHGSIDIDTRDDLDNLKKRMKRN